MKRPTIWPFARRHYYMGQFSVPPWFFNACPQWMHEAADWLGGVEPSPWRELARRIRKVLRRQT